jgi:hypothetical protein
MGSRVQFRSSPIHNPQSWTRTASTLKRERKVISVNHSSSSKSPCFDFPQFRSWFEEDSFDSARTPLKKGPGNEKISGKAFQRSREAD